MGTEVKSEVRNGKKVSLTRNGHGGWAIMVDSWLAREVYTWKEANRRFEEVLANL